MKIFKWGLLACLPALILFCSMAGCKKIEPISPPVSIRSVRALSLTDFEVVIRFEYVDLYKIKKCKITFDDITGLTESNIEKEFILGKERNQTDTIIVETDRNSHDFYVTATAETTKGLCTSDPVLVRSTKYNFSFDIIPNNTYSELQNKIADFVNSGGNLGLKVQCYHPYNASKVEVRLNRTISLVTIDHFLEFSSDAAPYYHTMVSAGVPFDVQPGIYEVYLYIDGVEFKSANNIKVVPGVWSLIEQDYQGGSKGNYAWFVKGDYLYLIGGEYFQTDITESQVWKYDIPNNQWERKSNFPHPGDVSKNKIMPFNLVYNGEGYIVIKNDTKVEVWKYNIDSDTWTYISAYPGEGYDYMTAFITRGKLFLGGGAVNYVSKDFWAYDFESAEWQRKSDMPEASHGCISVVVSSGKAYVFPYSGEFWQYDPDNDTWKLKAHFPGHSRISSRLVLKDDKIYMSGGLYIDTKYYPLNDCWSYSENDNKWEPVAFLPVPWGSGVSFIYNGFIYSGLGWPVDLGAYIYDNPVFYKLNI